VIEFLQGLQAYGYFGAFLGALIGTATIFFPMPFYLMTFALGAVLNPFLLGIVTGIGSAIGELIGYAIGYGGRKLIKKRWKKHLDRARYWFDRNGLLTIFIFAVTPLPDDIIGILAGSASYDKNKFFLACLAGKTVLGLLIAYSGKYSFDLILKIFGIGI